MASLHLCVCLCTTFFTLGRASHADRPNIIFIMADDLGWGDVGFHGSDIDTPNIDQLANSGVILNNYYVSPLCTPTRGSLMTGKHPIHLGLQHYVIVASEPWGLPLEHTTMAEHLRGLGYRTHIVGKWHLGFFQSGYLPTNRGFDSHYGFLTGFDDYYTRRHTEKYTGFDFRRNLKFANVTGYGTELFTEEAVTIITEHKTSEPLFLYLAHQAVHIGSEQDPLQVPQHYIDRVSHITDPQRRTFAGMTAALDDSVGAVLDALRSRDMLSNTVLVFTSDNGGPRQAEGSAACNYPLRGLKNTLWEGGVRTVGFVYSDLLDNHGTVTNNMMHVSDWLPTLYSAAGGDVQDLGQMDGLNLWTMLKTAGDPIRTEILHNINPILDRFALRSGDFKIVGGDQSRGLYDGWYQCAPTSVTSVERSSKKKEFYTSLRNHNNQELADKLLRQREDRVDSYPMTIKCGKRQTDTSTDCAPKEKPCLFNIAEDPCEYNNIADKHPERVTQLLDRVDHYKRSAVPPVNKPSDPRANPKYHNGMWDSWLDELYL